MNRASADIAAEGRLFELWDRSRPFPAVEDMEDLEVVTHVAIERAQPEGFHYLHESAMAWHQGTLHLCWANHRQAEVNICDELIRGRQSKDGGLTWSTARTWVARPENGSLGYNQPVLFVRQEKLWGFFVRWDGQMSLEQAFREGLSCCEKPGVGPQPATELFVYDDERQTWQSQGVAIPGFLPFGPPRKLADGNWILPGELFWYDAAVALSVGDDWTRWQVVRIPKPDDLELLFPETTLLDQGDRLLAVLRPRHPGTAPVSQSTDGGRSWTPLQMSNFPLGDSKPFAGRLATGQHYLITCNREAGRHLLSIAVTPPGQRLFSRVWKIRHQEYPRRRHFPGYLVAGKITNDCLHAPTEWSYPYSIEHDGKLFISYTQGKEDCVLSIIPVSALAATR